MTAKAAALNRRGRPNHRALIAASKRGAGTRAAAAGWAALAPLLCLFAFARAGHEISYYPSFYPQEITLERVDPATAAARLSKNDLHAYLGGAPEFAGAAPEHLEPVQSLDGFLVLEFDPESERFAEREQRCETGRAVIRNLADEVEGAVLSPYPVTPYHPDYLNHLDRIEDARAALSAPSDAASDLKLSADGPRARALAGDRIADGGEHWDVRLQRVRLGALDGGAEFPLNGHQSAPWQRQGWHQAYRLLAGHAADPVLRQHIDNAYRRLARGEYADESEQLNLERRLVADLLSECRRLVAGYTLKRELYNADLSGGIENIAAGGQSGLSTPLFVRTAKLKDFPWNGWLHLGMAGAAEAAWNPVAGFTDPAGRLLWSALGDPALLPTPYNGGFIPNRVSAESAEAGGRHPFKHKLPPAALTFRPGSGELRMAGTGKTSSAKVTYRVLASVNQDGTRTEVSDLIYGYVFAFRWGAKAGAGDADFDPAVESATRLLRERLVGIRVLRVDTSTTQLAPDIQYTRETPVVEVYLDHSRGDPLAAAAIAPPWSAAPWHVLALMEAAVSRGLAAFSKEEAQRSGVPWLDLARDAGLQPKLRDLIDTFEREGYRPEALAARVSKEEASARWQALRAFADKHGHLLVTSGPYRLESWSGDKAVLEVVRELTYPWGVGAFDGYTYPARAVITDAKREGGKVILEADLVKVVKAQRRYRSERAPFAKDATRGMFRIRAESRYLLLDDQGRVTQTGKAAHLADGRFEIELPVKLAPGRYTLLAGLHPDGNALNPAAVRLDFEAGS